MGRRAMGYVSPRENRHPRRITLCKRFGNVVVLATMLHGVYLTESIDFPLPPGEGQGEGTLGYGNLVRDRHKEALMWIEALSWEGLGHLADALGVVTAVPFLVTSAYFVSRARRYRRRLRQLEGVTSGRPVALAVSLAGTRIRPAVESVLCRFWATGQVGGAASARWPYPDGDAGGLVRAAVLEKSAAR